MHAESDWHYPEPGEDRLADKDILFNQKVVRAWHMSWTAAKDDESKWLRLTKQEAKPEEAPKKPKKLDDF